MERKYARICWNTSSWKKPTGEARKLEVDSFVAANGFGHEEWLFNFDWVLPARQAADVLTYKYGYTQSLGKFYHAYRGNLYDVLLYTFPPDRIPRFVGRIKEVLIPMEGELDWARQQITDRGWMEIMKRQLRGIGCDDKLLDDPIPFHVHNMRYRLSDVSLFNPMVLVPPGHKIRRMYRYHPMNWDDGFKPPAGTAQG